MGMSAAEFLLDELRHVRLALNLSQEEFGKLINYSGSHVGSVENGSRAPKEDYLAAIDKHFHTGGIFVRMLRKVIVFDVVPPWFREWARNELRAVFLRWFELAFVPGLLQTEAYARAVVSADNRLTPEQVDVLVADRLKWQARLDDKSLAQVVTVLDEAVLHRAIGGAAVMREQLLHLARLNQEHPRVRIQVVPATVGAYPGLDGPLIIATLPENDEVVYLESRIKGQVLSRPDDVAEVRKHWEDILAEALPPTQSTELILEVAERWT
ncbi:helix-turn-helix transcriptional regulator [Plantactinospora sp. B5E13]|uniref:helix-turn-helix domain-containing protein n=1 Tax=unclassified Plantactinospora TaxID=2631981 RepID=UPI00325DEC06